MKLKSENVYCCFNSILARLVHEQGRPQVSRGWGSSEQPDCTGFSIGEFAALDFSQMNLGEYMQYVQTKTNISPAEMEAIQQRAITVTGAGGS
nr:conjugal transfer protein TraN [Syntrophales bacterium]